MQRAWRWYWRTLSESWRRMTARRRRMFAVLLTAAIGLPGAIALAMLLMPSARAPMLIGILVLCACSDMLLTVMRRARRRRRQRTQPPERRGAAGVPDADL